jgi:hypothetical protein
MFRSSQFFKVFESSRSLALLNVERTAIEFFVESKIDKDERIKAWEATRAEPRLTEQQGVARLKELRREALFESQRKQGKEAGAIWAREEARPEELACLAELMTTIEQGSWGTIDEYFQCDAAHFFRHSTVLGDVILTHSVGNWESPESDEFWSEAIGVDNPSNDLLCEFMKSALEFWNKVKAEVYATTP